MSKKPFMKKIYSIFSLFCLTAIFAEAQFEPGQKVIGGNIGFSAGKSEYPNSYSYTSYSNVSISPSISSFTKPNLLCGIGLSYAYNYTKTKNSLNEEIRGQSNSIGINFFSQRFFTLTQNLFFTINTSASAYYSFGKQINTTNNIESEAKSSGYGGNANFAPGLTCKLTQRLLFDAYLSNLISIGYSHNETKDNNIAPPNNKLFQNNFNLSSSLSNTSLGNVGLGFRWVLKK